MAPRFRYSLRQCRVQVKEQHQPLVELGHAVESGYAVTDGLLAGWLDILGAEAQHFTYSVNQEPNTVVGALNDDDARLTRLFGRAESQSATEVNDREHLAAQVDDTLDIYLRLGHT